MLTRTSLKDYDEGQKQVTYTEAVQTRVINIQNYDLIANLLAPLNTVQIWQYDFKVHRSQDQFQGLCFKAKTWSLKAKDERQGQGP